MDNPLHVLSFRSRYFHYMKNWCSVRAAQAEDEQAELTFWYYHFLEQVQYYQQNTYTATALAVFQEGLRQQVSPVLVFDQMERWRKRCALQLEQSGTLADWQSAPDVLVQDSEREKLKFIRRYFGYMDMVVWLADEILSRFPLSAEAVQLRKAIGETMQPIAAPVNTQATTETKQVITVFPEEMNIEEAALFLKSTVDRLYQLTSQRQIPHYKRGRRLIFILSELKRWRLSKVLMNAELDTLAANEMFLGGNLPGKRKGGK